jgi:hypothetical protein
MVGRAAQEVLLGLALVQAQVQAQVQVQGQEGQGRGQQQAGLRLGVLAADYQLQQPRGHKQQACLLHQVPVGSLQPRQLKLVGMPLQLLLVWAPTGGCSSSSCCGNPRPNLSSRSSSRQGAGCLQLL